MARLTDIANADARTANAANAGAVEVICCDTPGAVPHENLRPTPSSKRHRTQASPGARRCNAAEQPPPAPDPRIALAGCLPAS